MKFIDSICYICGEPCEEGHYAHHECCICRAKFLDEQTKEQNKNAGVPKKEWKDK